MQKQAEGWTWPTGCSLLTPCLKWHAGFPFWSTPGVLCDPAHWTTLITHCPTQGPPQFLGDSKVIPLVIPLHSLLFPHHMSLSESCSWPPSLGLLPVWVLQQPGVLAHSMVDSIPWMSELCGNRTVCLTCFVFLPPAQALHGVGVLVSGQQSRGKTWALVAGVSNGDGHIRAPEGPETHDTIESNRRPQCL